MAIIIHTRGELHFQRIQRVFVSLVWCSGLIARRNSYKYTCGSSSSTLHERPRAKRASATDFRDDTLNGKAERWHPNSELRWRSLEAVLSAVTVNDRPFKSSVSRFIAPRFWFYVMRFSFLRACVSLLFSLSAVLSFSFSRWQLTSSTKLKYGYNNLFIIFIDILAWDD